MSAGDFSVNDPPSPAAGLLDTLITDMADLGDNTTYEFGAIADTQPGGIGEAAVHVHDTVTNADHVIICLPASYAGKDGPGILRLWAELTRLAVAGKASGDRDPDVPMVCTACRLPVRRFETGKWHHVTWNECAAAPVKAMVAAGNGDL